MKTLKSIGAVLAGLIALVILDNTFDTIMEAMGVYPKGQPFSAPWMILIAITYRGLDGILGAYIAATLAPSNPMKHALTIGFIGVFLNTVALISIYWLFADSDFAALARQTPAWYGVGLAIISLPCAWLGGKIRVSRVTNS